MSQIIGKLPNGDILSGMTWDHRFKKDILRHFTTALLKYVKSTWCEVPSAPGQTRAFSEPLPSRDLNLRVTLQSGWACYSVSRHLFTPSRSVYLSHSYTGSHRDQAWNGPVLTTF